MTMILKYTLSWFALLVAAVTNGIIRQSFFLEKMGDLHAHQLSTVTGILLFAVIIWGLSRIRPLKSATQAWTIGFIWLGMTLAFEFLFFHYVGGKPWDVLLHDYNILEGRIWPLILVWVTIAPYVFHKMR